MWNPGCGGLTVKLDADFQLCGDLCQMDKVIGDDISWTWSFKLRIQVSDDLSQLDPYQKLDPPPSSPEIKQ